MVWVLRAVDAASATQSAYYLKSAAMYSVGRKDCYITIQTDKTISRLHANIRTDEARAAQKDVQDVASIPRMPLRVHDLSKFGTFVNKKPGSKPIISMPGSEAPLNDGDIVTFGTNRTSFRVEFIPFFLCISSTEEGTENPTLKYARRHGAYAVDSWKEGCTHVLVDEGSGVTEMVIAAVTLSKPVVQINWWQKLSTEPDVISELLPYSSYLPTLVLQREESSIPVKIALPEVRKGTFQGYTFFLGPLHLYAHGNYLPRFLEAAGSKVEFISKTPPSQQAGADVRQQLVVKPRDGMAKEGWRSSDFLDSVAHLPRTSEENLMVAVLEGHVDVTKLALPSSPVASADTDETREDSDGKEYEDTGDTLSFKAIESTPVRSPQEDRRQSIGTNAHVPIDLDDDEPVLEAMVTSKRQRPHEFFSREQDGDSGAFADTSGKRLRVESQAPYGETPRRSTSQKDRFLITETKEINKILGSGLEGMIENLLSQENRSGSRKVQVGQGSDMKNRDKVASQGGGTPFVSSNRRLPGPHPLSKVETLESESPRMIPGLSQEVQNEIIISKLVVRKEIEKVPLLSSLVPGSVANFKRFTKKGLGFGVSGNTYTTLVPFAKEPYRESDLGRECNEFMQEERRRKEAETLADDLFNAERLKRQNAMKPKPRAPGNK